MGAHDRCIFPCRHLPSVVPLPLDPTNFVIPCMARHPARTHTTQLSNSATRQHRSSRVSFRITHAAQRFNLTGGTLDCRREPDGRYGRYTPRRVPHGFCPLQIRFVSPLFSACLQLSLPRVCRQSAAIQPSLNRPPRRLYGACRVLAAAVPWSQFSTAAEQAAGKLVTVPEFGHAAW